MTSGNTLRSFKTELRTTDLELIMQRRAPANVGIKEIVLPLFVLPDIIVGCPI